MKEQKKGISLIVLVITIIVMIILASAVIISLSNSNIITKANEAVRKSDVKNFEQELSLSLADMKLKDATYDLNEANAAALEDMKKYIPDFTDKYYGKLIVQNGKLAYVTGNVTEEEKQVFESIGLQAGNYITVSKAEEIKALAEAVTIDSTVSSTEVTTYITNMPVDYSYMFTIFQGNLYYRYEKTTYDERVSLHAAGIPFLVGDVDEDGTISELDSYLIDEYQIGSGEGQNNNIYYVGDVNYDRWIDSIDSSLLLEVLESTSSDATKYTDLANVDKQNLSKIEFLGDYHKIEDIIYFGKIGDKDDIANYLEIMKADPRLSKDAAQKVCILDFNVVYRYEMLTTEEFGWIKEYSLYFNLGDGNFDGYIDEKDLNLITKYTQNAIQLTDNQKFVLDINGDGIVSALDINLLSEYLNGTKLYCDMMSNYYSKTN